MKIKDLIKTLEACSPNAEIIIESEAEEYRGDIFFNDSPDGVHLVILNETDE